jgi:glycosyltransferase involved in cell wall biosynthesis
LIGGSGPEAGRLEQRAGSLGLQDQVRFLGYIPEGQIGDYFALADVFVFPSIFETFGIVLAQAMAAGLPVAAARASAVPEVVVDGVTGLLSPPLDAPALARNIRRLLEDEDLRRKMGQAARAKAERDYDWERVARRYAAVFERVAGATGLPDRRSAGR